MRLVVGDVEFAGAEAMRYGRAMMVRAIVPIVEPLGVRRRILDDEVVLERCWRSKVRRQKRLPRSKDLR